MDSHGQWWSIFKTHRLHVEQWCVRSGLGTWHFLQYRGAPVEETVMFWTPSRSVDRSRVGRTEYAPFRLDEPFGGFNGDPGSVKTATVYERFAREYNRMPRSEMNCIDHHTCLDRWEPNPIDETTQTAHVERLYTKASGKKVANVQHPRSHLSAHDRSRRRRPVGGGEGEGLE